MFASLLRSKKGRPSESTPLLSALNRYQSEPDGDDDDQAWMIPPDDRDDDDEDEDQDGRRDGPLLPVFASTFLGMYSLVVFTRTHTAQHGMLTRTLSRSYTHLQHHPCDSFNPHRTMRNHAFLGPVAFSPSFTVSRQAHPATATR